MSPATQTPLFVMKRIYLPIALAIALPVFAGSCLLSTTTGKAAPAPIVAGASTDSAYASEYQQRLAETQMHVNRMAITFPRTFREEYKVASVLIAYRATYTFSRTTTKQTVTCEDVRVLRKVCDLLDLREWDYEITRTAANGWRITWSEYQMLPILN